MSINILSIGGELMPTPHTYKVQYADLDSEDTGRTETGMLSRTRVREGIAKIELKWDNISEEDCIKILTAVSPDSFNVTYFFGSYKNAEMYAGDKSIDLLYIDSSGVSHWAVAFNMIEY